MVAHRPLRSMHRQTGADPTTTDCLNQSIGLINLKLLFLIMESNGQRISIFHKEKINPWTYRFLVPVLLFMPIHWRVQPGVQ